MKKILLYSIVFFIFKTYSSLSWGFEVKFKSEITCDLFYNEKKFTTKTWPLSTDKDDGYLNWATDTILEWHESIAVSQDPLKWSVLFYHVDRYSGQGNWKATTELSNDFFMENFLNKNLIRRDADLLLEKHLDLSGIVSCREENKKF
tara:strand:- start:99 stop:539 length:441 start_codon:yes stop_codon:yes gene_type:complete